MVPVGALTAGCAASPAPAPVPAEEPARPVTTVGRALEADVALGLGERAFTMTLSRKDGSPGEKIRCLNFSYEVIAPRDAASGQATGRRQHKPITIIKEWDATSPLLLQALVSQEPIASVKLEFSRSKPGSPGGMDVFQEITLRNAQVSGIASTVGEAGGDCDDARKGARCPDPRELEEVSFVCQSMTVRSLTGGTTAEDAWTTP
jgi:type VI secretion system secreted protein Hcp